MDIRIDGIDPIKDPDTWSRAWYDAYNAHVAAIVADGAAKRFWQAGTDLSRDDFHDEQVRGLFWRQLKPEHERSMSDKAKSPDAYLYEGVVRCMVAARDDERKRLSRCISKALESLLGDEFRSVMYDIIEEHDMG